MKRLLVFGLAALATAACLPSDPVVTPHASAAPKAAATRSLAVHVAGPTELAKGGRIAADNATGLFKGGQVISDHAAFRILGSERFAHVGGATIRAVTLDGTVKGAEVTTGEDGAAKVTGLPTGKTLSLVAAFKVGDKVYRLAASLAADELATIELDPINTMVEARVRDLLAGKEPTAAAKLDNARLARVWTICNNAGVTLAPAELEAGRSEADMTESLTKAWKAAIEAQVTTADEKAEISAFIADLAALAEK